VSCIRFSTAVANWRLVARLVVNAVSIMWPPAHVGTFSTVP
jgi:hypothetical protein